MLNQVQIPGFGTVVMGLDWLTLQGMDGKREEIRQLGRGVDAGWQYVWAGHGQVDDSVAFIARGQSKKRPVAAAALIRAAIAEDLYLTLIEVDEDRFWLFAVQDNVPMKRADLVGTFSEVVLLLKDLLSAFQDPSKLPVYTDQQDRLAALPYTLDLRPFSLEILSHSINKRDMAKAAFSRHTSVPVIPILLFTVLVAGGAAYYMYQVQVEETARRDASLIRERAVAQRKLELGNAVDTALNATASARVSIPAYLAATSDLKRSLAGWKLTGLECAGSGCTLTYQAQAFATWAGYLAAKPDEWPAPTFDSNIEKVTQPIVVQLPDSPQNTLEGLPTRDAVNQALGNLAQVSKMLGLNLTLPSSWARVAGDASMPLPEEDWIPMIGGFDATGSAVLLENLATRLPATSGVSSVTFKLDDPLTFELKGAVYANP
ncbi:type 4b pilus protein PilO2 [Pseudomonas syringae]|nr:type 4b pilus protein PilO2 [Pseudomonas syringae]MBD8803169.1 type 4b pilus protein PilO2 [Pseudomonas syringae]MBD8813989.1 type 4b pilus protein PilO2 [Pseudomonas syringae]